MWSTRERPTRPTDCVFEERTPSARHFLFVACMSTVSGVLACAVPLAVYRSLHRCEDPERVSLYADVRRSVDPSVSPCDDFHRHVCGRWKRLRSPVQLYEQRVRTVLRNVLLLHHSGSRQLTAKDKAYRLFFRCVSSKASENSLRSFLRRLRLAWPAKLDVVSRLDILDTIIGSSLDYSVPALWTFTVGRHSALPHQSTIYVYLDPSVLEWMAHLRRLASRRRLRVYLRRCAEIIGGTGQSYQEMIQLVLRAHVVASRAVRTLSDIPDPLYVNFSDVDMRVAVNRHLPDSSQLWPQDTMLVIHVQLFRRFLETFTESAEVRTWAQLYVGAYLVWYLSPFTSHYLTDHLMMDLSDARETEAYVTARCFEAFFRVMPLAVLKSIQDELPKSEKEALFEVFGEVRNALYDATRLANATIAEQMRLVMSSLSLTAFNMTLTWEMIEMVYDYVPKLEGSFFDMYVAVATAAAAKFKKSLHQTDNDVHHLPLITHRPLYSLLVLREVRIPTYLRYPPAFHSSFPAPLKMATLGNEIAFNLGLMLYYIYYRTTTYESRPFDTIPYPNKLLFEHVLGFLKPALDKIGLKSSQHVHLLVGSYGLDSIQRSRFFGSDDSLDTSGEAHSLTPTVGTEQDFGLRPVHSMKDLSTWELHRLFYMVACFIHCRNLSSFLLQKAICNVALPITARFSRVFKCVIGDSMFSNVTWEGTDTGAEEAVQSEKPHLI
ncbi:uncharacterized protein LOC142571103 [Dermacentor variabilis]|uniref:uncharacterized protein LOC142571103 n=1 Tax=Dermacentor variabilis TaxID=34621 RepID=UPI003F5B7B0B